MKLFEYQAKRVFTEAGITVPRSTLVETSGPARAAVTAAVADAVTAYNDAAVIKAQVLMGGRGKRGLVRKATAADAAETTEAILDADVPVPSLLVEELVAAERELYLAITIDAPGSKALVLASAEGGIDIEELAATRPEAIVRFPVDLRRGLLGYEARSIAYQMGLEGRDAKGVASVLISLWRVFRERDAELVEINPLFVTADGVVAGDGKVSIDDNSLFRQPGYAPTRDHFESDAEFEAAREGIPYLQFDGDISLMCAGAGLTTTVFDLVHYEGGTVANYLEFGGPNYRRAKRAMELCLRNESAVILIVTFGTIARADVMAEGVVEAIRELKPDRPIVTCIRGTNEEGAVETLKAAGIEPLFDTEEAVRRAVAIAAERGGAAGLSGGAS